MKKEISIYLLLTPPRSCANKRRGHGTFENDRPPVVGTVGRTTGLIRIEVRKRTTKSELNEQIESFTKPQTTCNTNEWSGYSDIYKMERTHKTVRHGMKNMQEMMMVMVLMRCIQIP